MPVPKVAAAGVGGAVGVIVVWLLGVAGVDASPEVGAALSTLFGFAAGYVKAS